MVQDNKWFLFLEGQYRDFVYQQLEQKNADISMDFVLIITIVDPTETKDVYNETIRELSINNFEFEMVDVDLQIKIDS